MKKTVQIFALMIFSFGFSQVGINTENISSSSVSLEFQEDMPSGIVLPYVTTVAGTPAGYDAITNMVDGTLIYDIATKKVRVRQSNQWKDLTDAGEDFSTSIQDNRTEGQQANVTISTDRSKVETNNTPNGILVLLDEDKAMVLPRMANPHLVIKNPAPGMIAYDTANNLFAVFNGTTWSFWKGN